MSSNVENPVLQKIKVNLAETIGDAKNPLPGTANYFLAHNERGKFANVAVSGLKQAVRHYFTEVLDDQGRRVTAKNVATEEGVLVIPHDLETIIRSHYTNLVRIVGPERLKDLAPDLPPTLSEFVRAELRPLARDVLEGKLRLRTEGTREASSPNIIYLDDTEDVEAWKRAWFEGDTKEIEWTKVFQALGGVKYEGDLEQFPKDVREVLESRGGLGGIRNLNELRELAMGYICNMYAGNEVGQESNRRIILDFLILKARELDKTQDQERAKYTENMINAMREFYIFWEEGWIGKESGLGSSAALNSIATYATRFADASKYIEFLLHQEKIIQCFCTQTIGTMQNETREITGTEKKDAVAKILGRRLRRATGEAVHDQLDRVGAHDYGNLITRIHDHQEPPPPTGDNVTQAQMEAYNQALERDRQEFGIELANDLFQMLNLQKPHSVDYTMFLIFFMPWYFQVKYLPKYAGNIDLLLQQNENVDGMVAGALPQEAIDALARNFQFFNLVDLAPYSALRRPENSEVWLEQLSLYAETYRLKSTAERLPAAQRMAVFDQEIKAAKDALEVLPVNATYIEKQPLKSRVAVLEKAKEVYLDFQRENPEDFDKFLQQGLDVAMKLISTYEAGVDKRTNGQSQSRWADIEAMVGSPLVAGYEHHRLLQLSEGQKYTLLQGFLNPHLVRLDEQHTIVGNNLMRTVPLNQEIYEQVVPLCAGLGYPQAERWFRPKIYQPLFGINELFHEKSGKTWLKYLDFGRFSFNAEVIYGGYAEKVMRLLAKGMGSEAGPAEMMKMIEELESPDFGKHFIRVLPEFDRHTQEMMYQDTTGWRLNRMLRSMKLYVDSVRTLYFRQLRCEGVRGQLTLEAINPAVQEGTWEEWYRENDLGPALSQAQIARGFNEPTYKRPDRLAGEGDDYKTRVILGRLCMERNEMAKLVEIGYLNALNEGKKPTDDGFVDFDILLLRAGEKLEGTNVSGVVNGLIKDEPICGAWDRWHQRIGGHRRFSPEENHFSPQERALITQYVRRRAAEYRQEIGGGGGRVGDTVRGIARRISGASDPDIFKRVFVQKFGRANDERIWQILEQQFKTLHTSWHNPDGGTFEGMFTFQRVMHTVDVRFIDEYVCQTFHRDRRFYDPTGPKAWPRKDWGEQINLTGREDFKIMLMQATMWGGEGSPSRGKYIYPQSHPDRKQDRMIFTFDEVNLIRDSEGRIMSTRGYDGTGPFERIFIGTGVHKKGQAAKISRVTNYPDPYSQTLQDFALLSAQIAVAFTDETEKPEWFSAEGVLMRPKANVVYFTPGRRTLSPLAMSEMFRMEEDPGGEALLGDTKYADALRLCGVLQKTHIKPYLLEAVWLDQVRKEGGGEAPKSLEEHPLKFFNTPADIVMGVISTATGGGKEATSILGWDQFKQDISKPLATRVFWQNLGVAALPTVLAFAVSPLVGIPVGVVLFSQFVRRSISWDDFEVSNAPWNVLFDKIMDAKVGSLNINIGQLHFSTPNYWNYLARNPNWLTAILRELPIPVLNGGWTPFLFVRRYRQWAASSASLTEGRRPVTPVDIIDPKPLVEELKYYKQKGSLGGKQIGGAHQ